MGEIDRSRDIWVFGDRRSQAQYYVSMNLLAGVQSIASGMSARVVVVVVDQEATGALAEGLYPMSNALEDARNYGADAILLLTTRDLPHDYPHIMSRVLKNAVFHKNPALFLFPLSDILREVAARCAFSCSAGLIADAEGLVWDKAGVKVVCPSYGGQAMAELGFSEASKTGFITVQPNAFNRQALEKPFQGMETLAVDLPEEPRDLVLESRVPEKPAGLQLESAKTVVVGGAGLGNMDGFRKARKLAAVMGAALGATRPPVLWHWTDEQSLIGQTGKTIAPDLLLTAGVSGAVQFTAGVTRSKHIVAINRDPNAPIFQMADMGIVGDANIFLPLLIDELQKRMMRSLADSLDAGAVPGQESDFGSKLAAMRSSHGFTLEDVARKMGQSPESIAEIEANKTTPSVGFLITISEIFGVDPGTFLNEEERSSLSEKRAREYTRRTGSYFYRTLTPGAESEHLRVFMIYIESNRTHKSVAYRHEGEEFVYVMEGRLQLTLGEKEHTLVQGECLKFNSETPHRLKSLGDEGTRCLVALYTP